MSKEEDSSNHALATKDVAMSKSSDSLSLDKLTSGAKPHEHLADLDIPGGSKMKGSIIDGKHYPMFCTQARFKEVKDMEVRDTDIFLISYPKTGTHWMYSVISKLLELTLPRMFIYDFDMPSSSFNDIVDTPPRLIVLHGEVERIPAALLKSKAKVIYTVRNPKDATVSFFHHLSKMPPPSKFCGTWNNFFDWVFQTEEGGVYGGMLNHIRGYQETFRGQEERFLTVAFEDMKLRTQSTMERVASFLGANMDPQHISNVISQTEFKALRAEREEKKDMALFLYRKGEVGDWKNMFTVAQSEFVDEVVEKNKETLGCEFLYS